MKTKLLYIFLLLFCSFAANAQELTFKSFAMDPNDLDARTKPVKDYNDVPCALVKVGLVVPGAKFEGYTVKTERKTSEYWVYLIDGAENIEIQTPGYQTFNFDFPEPLKMRNTYRLVLNVPQTVAKSRIEMANLKITTEPKGAKVLINGQEETPLQNGFYRLPKGTLDYRVTAEKYHDQSGTVNFEKDGQTLHVKLAPKCGTLSINSNPMGATITINGKKYGTTPNVIDNLLIGSYDVVLRKQGYADFNTTARVQENQESIVVATMKEQNGMGKQNVHEYVDLGLSVKWATCNVGASKPEDYGDYFAWGETTAKTTYNWSTYTLCKGSSSTMTKYCISSSYGTVDNKTTLELADDAANKNWGGSWRMPTKAEQDELRTQCTWTWTSQSGVNGYKVTSKSNGNSIFLPAAGSRYEGSLSDAGSDGLYWSSSLYESTSYYACGLYFYSGFVDAYDGNRCYGQSVRAVCP